MCRYSSNPLDILNERRESDMRLVWLSYAMAISGAVALRGEIHDVMKNVEIEAGLAKVKGSSVIHQRPNFSISLNSQERRTAEVETHDGADEMLFIRRGSGLLWLEKQKYEIGPGDVVNIRRKTAHHIDAPSGRIEYIAVRIITAVEG